MVDEMFDRAYQASRAELNARINASFGQLSRTVGDGLRALHRIEWSAPWHAKGKRSEYN